MNRPFEIFYHPDVPRKDLAKIYHDVRGRMKMAIEQKSTISPIEFGDPLRRTLKGYWKLRVGDDRVIYKIEAAKVIILRIGRRR